ncbi:S-adenosyl-L-methionine:benzoic acid/salicylic acid carboxyl methyltransferase 2-like [Rutidosis leptorrhynchoides]|uniref:S-adenosyl-L-methionine:benzoic acid/salicylic acid carboxyl methyltransferase 2-like n=1 Tax=Rutidosis leptorrhynchoides TaxID=125765 RepID=UPI003A98F49F
MDVAQVLHMNGGKGENSCANNSLIQKKVIAMTKPIMEEALTNLYSSTSPSKLAIADLGCSSGPNTFLVTSEIIEVVDRICRNLNKEYPEYHVFLNDLPGNDFNAIFRSLPSFLVTLKTRIQTGAGKCFFTGVPGSFYSRLFPTNSLNFVYSSYSLMWLSQVPEGVENNKGNIYMACTSPPNVLKAYYEQFQRDFTTFLECRSKELVVGGRMVLTLLGRRSSNPADKECCYIWELMALALNEMVDEGIIEEEKLDSFNIAQYAPYPDEVRFTKEGSFKIDRLKVSKVYWNPYNTDKFGLLILNPSEVRKLGDGYGVAKYMRAVAEPLLVSHFGEQIIDEVFIRYQKIVADRMAKEETEFVNVTVSMTKRG